MHIIGIFACKTSNQFRCGLRYLQCQFTQFHRGFRHRVGQFNQCFATDTFTFFEYQLKPAKRLAMAVDDVVLAGSDDGLHHRGRISAVGAADSGEHTTVFPGLEKQGLANHVGLNGSHATIGGWQRRGERFAQRLRAVRERVAALGGLRLDHLACRVPGQPLTQRCDGDKVVDQSGKNTVNAFARRHVSNAQELLVGDVQSQFIGTQC